MDPKLTQNALNKLNFLMETHPQADIAGVLVRIEGQAVVVTREGRVQWFQQDGLGGIKQYPDPDPRSPVDVFNAVKQRHNKG